MSDGVSQNLGPRQRSALLLITRSDYTALQGRRRGEGERGPGRGPVASPNLCIVGIASSQGGASVQVGR